MLVSTFPYGKWAIAATLTVAPRAGSVKCALILTPITCFGVSFKSVYIYVYISVFMCNYLRICMKYKLPFKNGGQLFLLAVLWQLQPFIQRRKPINIPLSSKIINSWFNSWQNPWIFNYFYITHINKTSVPDTTVTTGWPHFQKLFIALRPKKTLTNLSPFRWQ